MVVSLIFFRNIFLILWFFSIYYRCRRVHSVTVWISFVFILKIWRVFLRSISVSETILRFENRNLLFKIKLDRSSNQYEMQVCEIESSTEAKQLFQIPDTRNFLLYQQEGEKGEKHIISLWTAQFRCSYKATRNKDVKLHELMSNTKEAGPVNKVVFQSFMGGQCSNVSIFRLLDQNFNHIFCIN